MNEVVSLVRLMNSLYDRTLQITSLCLLLSLWYWPHPLLSANSEAIYYLQKTNAKSIFIGVHNNK